jgi:hypothetical protein
MIGDVHDEDNLSEDIVTANPLNAIVDFAIQVYEDYD